MSKQPRGNLGAAHTAGAPVANIFVDVEKFQSRFQEKASKSSKVSLKCNGGSKNGHNKIVFIMLKLPCLHSLLNIHSPLRALTRVHFLQETDCLRSLQLLLKDRKTQKKLIMNHMRIKIALLDEDYQWLLQWLQFKYNIKLGQHMSFKNMWVSLALDIVNSSWLQCMLAAATWYITGMAITELLAYIGNKNR
ncbi:hypothetical protein ACSQ67_012405 [Phaseolus vulgaris]